MKTKVIRIISTVMLVILSLVLVTITAGAIAKTKLSKQYPPSGQMVDVGGYKLHINCMGHGSPTIILESGWGDFSASWTYVQPEVAKTSRVCAYDRAGNGWSEPSPNPRTVTWLSKELHTLLANAHVEGPYVLVGHSLGGMIVRVFAHNYPDEVVGMVLVDAMHEEQISRLPGFADSINGTVRQFRTLSLLNSTGLMALTPQTIPNPGLPEDLFPVYRAIFATTEYFVEGAAEMNMLTESATEVRVLDTTSLGDVPLSVLTAGVYVPNPTFSETENQQFISEWQAMQSELTALSSRSKQVIADQSGHTIHLEQPELVIETILEMLDTLR